MFAHATIVFAHIVDTITYSSYFFRLKQINKHSWIIIICNNNDGFWQFLHGFEICSVLSSPSFIWANFTFLFFDKIRSMSHRLECEHSTIMHPITRHLNKTNHSSFSIQSLVIFFSETNLCHVSANMRHNSMITRWLLQSHIHCHLRYDSRIFAAGQNEFCVDI